MLKKKKKKKKKEQKHRDTKKGEGCSIENYNERRKWEKEKD